MIDINDLKAELLDPTKNNLVPFLEHLLPNGKMVGSEYCVGNILGEKGSPGSLKLETRGERLGLWSDFNGNPDEKGDIFDLVIKHNQAKGNSSYSLYHAMKEVSEWLNKPFEPRHQTANQQRVYNVPTIDPNSIVTDPECLVLVGNYLQSRGITVDTLNKYHVRATRGTGELNAGQPMMVFSNVTPQGHLLSMSFLGITKLEIVDPETGEKKYKHRAGKHPRDSQPCLWGWQAIPPNSRYVIITEGQIDAMTWATMGHPALSLPNGVKGLTWIEHELRNLQQFETIFIHTDNEPEVEKYRREIATRLGINRVRIVAAKEGYKDANDWLRAGALPDDFQAALDEADTFSHKFVVSARDIWDDVLKELFPAVEGGEGFTMPWTPNDTSAEFKLMMGTCSILAGQQKIGKSVNLQNILIYNAAQGHKIGLASMEFPPKKTFAWMAECVTAVPRKMMHTLGLNTLNHVRDWLHDRIHLLKCNTGFTTDDCKESFEWLRAVKGCTLLAADSLTTFKDVNETKIDQQIDAIKKFVFLSEEISAHIMIVAHLKKAYQLPNGELMKQSSGDIRGASALKDLAATIMLGRFNYEKREQMDNIRSIHKGTPEVMNRLLNEVWSKQPDFILDVTDHRETGDTPKYELWFHRCRQYTSVSDTNALIPYYRM